MSRWVCACAFVLLVPCTADAQTSRDEAIRLLLSGDYQRAAQALRPLAEDPTKPDPAAQFLLAILDDTGQGVPRNVPRACGLYRQVARMDGPFTGTAEALGRMLHEDSPIPEQMCSTGPWHDQPEASFTLGPGHTVQYTSNTIVLRYQGCGTADRDRKSSRRRAAAGCVYATRRHASHPRAAPFPPVLLLVTRQSGHADFMGADLGPQRSRRRRIREWDVRAERREHTRTEAAERAESHEPGAGTHRRQRRGRMGDHRTEWPQRDRASPGAAVMRLKAFAVAVAVLAGPSSVAAQSSVADGVAALARGDYQRAAEILRPNAERDSGGDPAAQFFLGSMYDAGLGVPRDPLRACALYHRASIVDQPPFGTAAMRLTGPRSGATAPSSSRTVSCSATSGSITASNP